MYSLDVARLALDWVLSDLLVYKLMERTSLESRKPKMSSFWGVTRDDGVDIGHSEYITRLTALRDSLIDQEQVYLAQALDRLRIHSLTNKNSTYRLRMISDDIIDKVQQPAPRKHMQTTVEKFRQMRIKPHRPSIFPIQGTQLLEQTSGRRGTIKDSGSMTSRSTKDNLPTDRSQKSSQAKLEESIQANLQRLLQPRSSIPNIGRKAIKQQENLEVKPKPLVNIRSRVHKHIGKHMINPSPAAKTHLSSTGVLSPDYQKMYAESPGLEPGYILLKDDTLDVDTIQGCTYDYYLVPPCSREAEDSNVLGLSEMEHSEHGRQNTKQTARNSKLKQTMSTLQASNTSDRRSEEKGDAVHLKNVISVVLPNNSYDDIAGPTFYSSDDDSVDLNYNTDKHGRSHSLNVVRSSDDLHLGSSFTSEHLYLPFRKHSRKIVTGNTHSPRAQENRNTVHEKKRSRDTPAVILSPATPDVGLTPPQRVRNSQKTSLERTTKQKEIRQRELQHLFEDVRELNMRTEQFTSKSMDTSA
uniref:Uncharacterized protein n=1 Tax=Biomphalaria glabrata TaxID=6526 RepID=A0A2C9JZM5_BIOGL